MGPSAPHRRCRYRLGDGSATIVAQAEIPPGATKVAKVTKPIKAGKYAMLCPVGGKKGPHYKLGQLEEFEIS